MRFRAHETFFIRKGWLSKGMKYVKQNPEVFIDSKDNPMDILGIGSNMVKSLRYWLQVVGLTIEPNTGKRYQSFTELGNSVYKFDRYIEELGTLQLLHYRMVINQKNCTSWYYFFNEFNMSEFTRDDFILSIYNYIMMQNSGVSVSSRSLNDDFSCIMNTYLSKYKTVSSNMSPENNIDCPFGELGLIDVIGKDRRMYKKTVPALETLNPWIILAIIQEQAKGKYEIGLNELLTSPKNIGKVFNLDAITMLDVLYKIEKLDELKIIRTAGLDIVKLKRNMTFQDCVDKYYESIS